ncbi:MAG: Phage tail fiber-like protein [Parcubacteria group bacterium GW2011_GWA2_49_9]|nr:MAG: Phage tail fiber-like protein [Parcubacteria group bacterium GW2011_GWA2_49_9]
MVVQENNKIGFRYSVSDPGPYQYLTANGATALQFHNTYTSDGTAKNYSFYGAVADTEILTVLGNGNVGIGTTGPGALLHTKSAAATHNHLKIDTTTAGTYHPYLDFSEAGTNKYTFVYYTDANFFNIEDGSGNSRISIADTTGNVGIGTTSPAALFAVGGAGYFTGNVGVGVNSVGTSGLTRYLTVGAVGSGESTGLNFRSNRTTAADVTSRVQFLNSASETARIETRLDSNATGGAMLFWTNTTGDTITERMRIDSSGNVGIGTTSPLSKLEIVGGDNVVTLKLSDFIAGTDAQKDAFVGMAHKLDVEEPVALIQGRSDGTDNKVWIGGAGLSFNMENAATEIGFFTATTDTTLNGTQQMVIKSTGNVGIGTTSPSKLLSISGVSGAPIMRLAVTSGSAVDAVTSAIEFRLDSGTSGGQKRQGAIKIINTDDTYNRTGRLGFFTSTYGAGSDVDTEAETERLSILATTGNVGIGTTSPIGKLHIFGNEPGLVIEDDGWTGGASALYKLNVSNTDGRFMVQRNTAVARDFSTYNEDLVISNAGNVGIGTTAPRAPLAFSASVGEKIRLYDDAANNIYGLDVQNGLLRIYAGSSPDDIGLGSRSGSTFTEAVRIKGSGNVGIGTTSPLSKLAVSGGASVGADYNIAAPTNGMIIQGNLGIGTTSPASLLDLATPTNGATNEYGTLRLGVLNSAASELYTIGRKSSDGVLTFKSHQNDAGGFRFNTQTSGADAERLTITNAGNVGIGTTSPTQKLVVSGGAISLDNNQSLNFNDTGGTSRRAVLLSSTNISLGDVDNNGFNTYILSGADNPIIFRYGTGESMRILGTTGNVGIGTTSPATKLEVAGAIRGGSFPQSTTNTGEAWVGRAADRTLGTFTLQLGGASAAGTSFEIVDRAWTKVISSISGEAPAGSLVVNSNGNVGIGTTAPEQKLHVYGSNAASLGYVLKLSHGDGLSSDIGVGILFSENATGDANRGKGAITYIGDGSGFDRGDFRFLQDSAADTGNPILSETVMIIKNGGNVGIGTIVPSGILSVTPTQYSTGTASQSLTTVTGVGTTWTSAMVGSQFVYADGTNGGTITAFTDTTHVTVSTSQTVASQAYKIAYTGLQVATTGNVGIGTVSPGAALHVSATMPDITSNPGIVQISSSDATAQNKGGTLTFGFNTSGGLVQNGAGIAGLKESATASNTAGYLALYSKPTGAANAERMRIDSTGNVGIGTTSPWAKLSVEGTVSFKSLTSSATGNAVCITTNNEITNAGGGTCTPSSLRFKENVVTLNKGFALDTLSQLRVTSFDYRNGAYSPEDGKGSYGMIAEEVAQIDPLLVDYGYDGQPLTLHFEKITGLLVQAVQEIGSVINLTGATTSAVTIDSQGNLGIGTSTPEYKLHVMGDVAATSFVNISTRTAKKDIEYYSESDKRSVSDKIRNIKIAEYRYNGESESAPLRLGLIAEEAPAEVLSASGKGVDVYKLSTFILAGLQEQQKRLEGLEVRIMALESLVASSTPQQGAGFSVASVAVAVKDLIASAGEWVVSKITAAVGNFGTAKVENGLEMKDSATGATYCVRITNGEWAKVQGSCAEASTPLNPPSEEVGGQTSSSGDTTAPILTVNGNNPATVAVGAVYADLGASVTDNVSTNLGVYALVNGVDVGVASNISINTASSTTYTIEYYAIDQAGNRGSAQRTVIVGAEVASAPAETVPDAVGTTTTSVLGSSTPAVAEETPSEPQPEVVEEIPTEPLTEATPEPAPVESESTPISESETATSTPAL